VVLSQAGCPGQTLGGSDGGTDDGGQALAGLSSLTITPATATLTVDNTGQPKSQAYVATGHFSNGQPDSDVTSQVNWKIDDTSLGGISAGVFTTSNQAGGQGTITASSGNISATAQIIVQFKPVVNDPSAPANAGTTLPPAATGPVMTGLSPVIVYPSNNTMFPRNIYKVLFQWNAGTGQNLYRLDFQSPQLTMSVYTTATSWQPNATQWGYMANSAAGSQVKWTVTGVNTANASAVYSSAPVNIRFSQNTVDGAIYYWSTTVAGVRRATVSDSAPTDFLVPATVGKCVACHTVSRNGARIGADIGGSSLGVYNVKDLSPVINPSQNIASSWVTFNPDNSRIVVASQGVLTLRNGNTGASINTVTLPMGKFGTMPDWSPDGKTLTFAYEAQNKDRGISGSSIATIQYSNDAWSNMKILVQSASNMDSKYYPSFSPDSQWIAYVSATGSSDNNNTARLMIISADGTKGPIDLGQANTIVNNQTLTGTAAQIADTMPTWAPTQAGQTMFLAFTSARAYGNVYAAGKYKQLWVAGIDPTMLAAGQDPSFPGFRLPFQGDTENSHRPFWAVDVLNPPPVPDGGTTMCISTAGADCSSAPCCFPYYCSSNGGGPPYTCQNMIGFNSTPAQSTEPQCPRWKMAPAKSGS
jgi:hypothetical protein